MTLGVEEEFLIVDQVTGELVGRAGELFTAARARLGADVTKELNLCQIEIGTPVCHDLAGVRSELVRLRTELDAAAVSIGTRIAATATHPFGSWRDQTIDPGIERYSRIADVYQVVARQQVIAGCHVHIGVDDRELRVEIMNRSREWLPAMVALSANSPFWQGVDTGYASYRLQIWQRWPTSGMPPRLESADEFDELVGELVSMDAIEDETFIYWYVRPSGRYPTVEFRAFDVCLDVDTTVAVAGLVRALAWTCRRDAIEGRPETSTGREALAAAMWRAARYGLDGSLISPLTRGPIGARDALEELVEHVGDGLDAHGDRDEVSELVAQIADRGNGATRQREARSADGNLRGTVRAIVAATSPDEQSDEPELPTAADDLRTTFALRVELSDQPSSLARVAAALGRLQVNIIDIDVHETELAVVDQIVVDAPASTTLNSIRHAVVAAGARRVDAAPTPAVSDHDPGVRALEVAAALLTSGRDGGVSGSVADLVPVDHASLQAISALTVGSDDRTRLAVGVPVLVASSAPTGDSYTAIVPRVGLGPVVFDALVVERTMAPFTVTEIARLRALLRFDVARIVASNESLPMEVSMEAAMEAPG